jgi:hypothetical protein
MIFSQQWWAWRSVDQERSQLAFPAALAENWPRQARPNEFRESSSSEEKSQSPALPVS